MSTTPAARVPNSAKDNAAHKQVVTPSIGQEADIQTGVFSTIPQQRIGDPRVLPASEILALQRKVGNRAVTQLLQAKLKAGQVTAPYEQEAERVADQVVNAAVPSDTVAQRMSEDDELQMKPSVEPLPFAGARAANAVLPAILQRKYELGAADGGPDLAVTPDSNRAGEVRAQNLHGQPLGLAANSPTPGAQPFGWGALIQAGHTLANENSSGYNAVRMHLWNGRLGGPGDEVWNLAPGPAIINSAMSAGPEMASKNATAQGFYTWLRTKVTYQNGPVNANDFTSVIPNHIEMEWGYMDPPNAPGKVRGPAVGNMWQKNIDQPAGALTIDQKAEYANWAAGDTVNLGTKLDAASDQERAQAFELVQHDDLKRFILFKYPAVYLGMQDSRKGAILTQLNPAEISYLFVNTLGFAPTDNSAYVEHLMFPLFAAGNSARAQSLFQAQQPADQLALIKAGGWPFLGQLGVEIIRQWSKTWDVFRLLPDLEKALQLGRMTSGDIDQLVVGQNIPRIRDLLDIWGIMFGKFSTADRLNYLKPRLSDDLWRKYRLSLRNQIYAEEHPPINKQSPRTRRQPAYLLKVHKTIKKPTAKGTRKSDLKSPFVGGVKKR